MSLIGKYVALPANFNAGATIWTDDTATANAALGGVAPNGRIIDYIAGSYALRVAPTGGVPQSVSITDHARYDFTDFSLTFVGAFRSIASGAAGLWSHSAGSGAVTKIIWFWEQAGTRMAFHVNQGGPNETVGGTAGFTPTLGTIYRLGLKFVGSTKGYTFLKDGATNGTATGGLALPSVAATVKFDGGETSFFDTVDIGAIRIYDSAETNSDLFTAMDADLAALAVTIGGGIAGTISGGVIAR